MVSCLLSGPPGFLWRKSKRTRAAIPKAYHGFNHLGNPPCLLGRCPKPCKGVSCPAVHHRHPPCGGLGRGSPPFFWGSCPAVHHRHPPCGGLGRGSPPFFWGLCPATSTGVSLSPTSPNHLAGLVALLLGVLSSGSPPPSALRRLKAGFTAFLLGVQSSGLPVGSVPPAGPPPGRHPPLFPRRFGRGTDSPFPVPPPHSQSRHRPFLRGR